MKSTVEESVLSIKEDLKNLAINIHEHPELGLEEVKACEWQVNLLKSLGFQVETPFAGLDTAFKATWGNNGPVFAFVSEYDALPELGHGCGHNLICTASIGAAYGCVKALQENDLPGTVVILGTPAEESKGGKIAMLSNTSLDGIDALIMGHPSFRTTIDTGSTAIQRLRVTFKGLAAHAAASPELGKNALDAVTLLFAGINAWRQHLPESSRIHGVIEKGGVVPNIIPDLASCHFFLRSTDDAILDKMLIRFRKIVEGAALMTETEAEIESSGIPYKARKPNAHLNSAYFAAAERIGLNPVVPERDARGSSDFGDFSQLKPASHVYFSISDHIVACHSKEFTEAAKTDYGLDQMIKAACALGNVGFKFFNDEQFRNQVVKEH